MIQKLLTLTNFHIRTFVPTSFVLWENNNLNIPIVLLTYFVLYLFTFIMKIIYFKVFRSIGV